MRYVHGTFSFLLVSVREIQPGVEYHILFHIGTQQMTLRIQLPTEFPKQQPLIWTNPSVQHNWVTDNGRIMSPGLVNVIELIRLVYNFTKYIHYIFLLVLRTFRIGPNCTCNNSRAEEEY